CWTTVSNALNAPRSSASACSLRSWPTQNDVPSPVSTTARTAESSDTSLRARNNPSLSPRLRALCASGRLSTTVATDSCRSITTASPASGIIGVVVQAVSGDPARRGFGTDVISVREREHLIECRGDTFDMAGNFVRTPPQDLATHEVHGTAAVGNEVRSKDDASAVENIGGAGIGQDIIGRAGHDTSGDPVGDGRIDDSAGSAGDEHLGFDRHDVVRCHNARAERAGAITALAVNVGGDNLGAVL